MEEFEPIRRGDIKFFETAFKANFKSLHAYAFTILKDEVLAEEMVQNVFYKIWAKREQLTIDTSLKAYLYKAVYHESLNHLRQQQVKSKYETYAMHHHQQTSHDSESKVGLQELEHQLRKALNDLPEQCRTIFQLSRFNELRYREIAEQLNISVKTVENQMGKALRLLRLKLVDFMPVILLIMNFLK
ncbi:RNA polymerase sigma-70 factor [Segetibacter sp. 3557_3]|uniref:RNA polymerase sigma-70 factor n=1 Tax=Segetibacter sp. 3557_3 TaxID=2547429 RepID=UPI001FB6D240|nr:RNA polymerase sigma-70 factor [Segetibacter sp. 3557_3]